MKKYKILKAIEKNGIVAVVRGNSIQEALRISKACMDGGISSIEITFTVPNADKVISELKNNFNDNLIIGAGTVLDPETARLAIISGAEFIVGPNFNKDIAKLCNRYQTPYIPGCMTINEIVKATEYGVDIIKVFPGSVFGPNFIRAIKGPLPNVSLMPTGGVNLDNVDQWIKSGCISVGVGSDLTKGTSSDITNTAKQFIDIIENTRKNN